MKSCTRRSFSTDSHVFMVDLADESGLGMARGREEERDGPYLLLGKAAPLKELAASELEPQSELDASRIVASSAQNAEILWRIEIQPG